MHENHKWLFFGVFVSVDLVSYHYKAGFKDKIGFWPWQHEITFIIHK